MLGRRILRPTPTKLVLNLQKSEHDANHFSIKNVLETTSNETNKVSPTVERLFEEQIQIIISITKMLAFKEYCFTLLHFKNFVMIVDKQTSYSSKTGSFSACHG